MESIGTSDFYEAAWYILSGCRIRTIVCTEVNEKISCRFTVTGENLGPLQVAYFQGEARVNLLEFRRVYGQINSWSHEAKKKYRNEERHKEEKKRHQEAGGEV